MAEFILVTKQWSWGWDKLGGFDEAVEEMKTMAKLKGKPKLIYPDKAKPRASICSLLSLLMA